MPSSGRGLIPRYALRETLMDAVLYHLAGEAERSRRGEALLGLSAKVVTMFAWYIQHDPDSTSDVLGDIFLDARTRYGIAPAHVGDMLRTSLLQHSGLGRSTAIARWSS
ncbi:hypothetical protein [Streptomyces sp. BH104]|uniref:hypothetical protein n=1 Tax=Streptomyces sp. BH104 TaxID=3410407 RepID=UPI003BB79371